MRTATLLAAAVCTGAAATAPVASADASSGPTPAQVRHAVRTATRSASLWATVNVCRRHTRGGVIGIRGEMPALGFAATLSMSFQLREYSASAGRFVWVRGATARRTTSIGRVSTGLQQDGAEFPYASDAGTLDAVVFFTWTRDGRTIASAVRMTTAGHHSAAFGSPKGYSAASCRL